MRKRENKLPKDGFTVIELLVSILVLTVIAAVAVSNLRSLRADNRDEMRKRDINAIYYQLEAFYERSGYYPKTISEKNLNGLDPESLTDSQDVAINESFSEYSYTPRGCNKEKCTSFELSTELEREATYTKLSLNK